MVATDTSASRLIAALLLAVLGWTLSIWQAVALDVTPILWRIETPMGEWSSTVEYGLYEKCRADGGTHIRITIDYQNNRVTVFCHQKIDPNPRSG